MKTNAMHTQEKSVCRTVNFTHKKRENMSMDKVEQNQV